MKTTEYKDNEEQTDEWKTGNEDIGDRLSKWEKLLEERSTRQKEKKDRWKAKTEELPQQARETAWRKIDKTIRNESKDEDRWNTKTEDRLKDRKNKNRR